MKRKKTWYVSMVMYGEASEGAGNCSVLSSEPDEACDILSCSVQTVAGFG